MSESQAVTIRQNGDTTITPDKTKSIWASAGADIKSPEVVRALGLLGEHYQLDPALGEVMLLGSKVYITFEGYLRIAEQNPAYEGYELNPMTEQERKDAKVAPDEFAYVCKVYRKDRRFPSVGYGIASDATISMGPMKLFKREVAEKRAFHRALKMAFRAGIPDYDEAVEAVDYQQPIAVQALPNPAIDDEPVPPTTDWPRFWVHIKGLGIDHEEAHKALGVGSVKDWPGSLDEAITVIERYVLARDTDIPLQQVATPSADLATSAQVRAIYGLGRDKHRLSERQTEEKSTELFGAIPAELTRFQASDFIKALQGTPTQAQG